jgi:cytochrome c oxidase cbb3-type subunit 2
MAFGARDATNDTGPVAQLSKAPASARSRPNPFAGQPDAIAAGRKLYVQHCAQCHGADARGLERAVDLHLDAVKNAPPGVLFWAIQNGRLRKGMPSWSSLPDERLWQLVSYLQTLK